MSAHGNKRLVSDSSTRPNKIKKTEKPKAEAKPLFILDAPDEVPPSPDICHFILRIRLQQRCPKDNLKLHQAIRIILNRN